MPTWIKHHTDMGWLGEGDIMFFETPLHQIAKIVAGERDGQTIILPTEGISIPAKSRLLLKFRTGSRCYYCNADVIEQNGETMQILLPQKYDSLARSYFYRCDVSRNGRLDGQPMTVEDISVAGTAIRISSQVLTKGKRYKYQLGRFTAYATVKEIRDDWVRLQFALRDNLSPELTSLVRYSQRHNSKRRRFASV